MVFLISAIWGPNPLERPPGSRPGLASRWLPIPMYLGPHKVPTSFLKEKYHAVAVSWQ